MLAVHPDTVITEDSIATIDLHLAKVFVGSTQSDKAFRHSIRRAHEKANKYANYVPYDFLDVRGSEITYHIGAYPSDIANVGSHDYWVMINLDDIAALSQYRKRNDVLPWYLYMGTHSSVGKNNLDHKSCRETKIGDKKIKDLSGLTKDSYTSIRNFPKGFVQDIQENYLDSSAFFREAAIEFTVKYFPLIDELPGGKEQLLQYKKDNPGALDVNKKLIPEDYSTWHPQFRILINTYKQAHRHFDRNKFEEKTLETVLPIIATWSTISILEQRVQVQGRNGEKATTGKKLYRKNYTEYGDQKGGSSTLYGVTDATVNGDGNSPEDYDLSKMCKILVKGKNYNKLESGGQYTIQYRFVNPETGKEIVYGRKDKANRQSTGSKKTNTHK